MERRRFSDRAGSMLEVASVPAAAGRLELGPNPLRAGQPLSMRWAGTAAGSDAVVDFYDLAGRLVASAPLSPAAFAAGPGRGEASAFGGSLEPAAIAGWPSGVYFGRVRGTHQPASRLVFLR